MGHNAKKGDLALVVKYGNIQRYVIKMRAAGIGVIVQELIARSNVGAIASDDASGGPW